MTETAEHRRQRLNANRGNGVSGGQFGYARHGEPTVTLARAELLLAGAPVPLCSPAGLTHIGSLNAEDKSQAFRSYEGQGLSVSQHPEAWQKIARLGGPVWNVERAGARFLDYHLLTTEQRGAIEEWGVQRGYVQRQPGFLIKDWDDDAEEFRWRTTTDADEAELERTDAAEYDTGTVVEDCEVVVATEAFPDTTVRPGDSDVDQILSTVWVSECAPNVDGVWWEDTYDPDALSAPRGVLVGAVIGDWVASATPHDDDD